MALPNSNISTTLVGNTLGSGSRDVGALCTHPNINKWSKWKPVRSNKVVGLVENDLIDVKFGLNVVEGGTIESLIDNIGQITYLKPRGSSYNEPYRIGDFRNYVHEATIPLGTGSSNDDVMYTIYKGGQSNPYWELFSLHTAVNVSGGIDYEELYSSFGTLYLGVHLTNGEDKKWYTDSEPLSNIGGQSMIYVAINMLHSEISSWVGETEVFFFLTNVKKEQGENYTPNTNDRFLHITTDHLNRNPIFVNISFSYPPGSQNYFVYMKNFIFHSNGYQSTATIAFSSIGEEYIGGTITNAEIVFYSEPTYTNEFQRNSLGTFTLSYEEEKTFVVDAYGPMNSDVFWKVFVAGVEISSGSQIR